MVSPWAGGGTVYARAIFSAAGVGSEAKGQVAEMVRGVSRLLGILPQTLSVRCTGAQFSGNFVTQGRVIFAGHGLGTAGAHARA